LQQIRNDQVTQGAKACSNCRLVKRCHLFREMTEVITIWNHRNEDLPFPFQPQILAQTCPDYESPLDVIRIAEATKKAGTV
jgi:hypothetical protein